MILAVKMPKITLTYLKGVKYSKLVARNNMLLGNDLEQNSKSE